MGTNEYAFDCTLRAAIRVRATSLTGAKQLMREQIDCAWANFGAWPDGDPILGEVSLTGDPLELYEVNGEIPAPACASTVELCIHEMNTWFDELVNAKSGQTRNYRELEDRLRRVVAP